MNGMDWLRLGVGIIVFAPLLYLLVRWWRKESAIFPETAKKYGLAHAREGRGSLFGNTRQASKLQGTVRGVPLQVAATYETRGRMRMRGTWIATRAPVGLAPCTINVSRTPPAATVHLVPSGEAQFDARRWVTSDAPAAVRALLTPAARVELLKCPQAEIRLVVDGEHLVLSFPGNPSSQEELHRPMDAVLAMVGVQAP